MKKERISGYIQRGKRPSKNESENMQTVIHEIKVQVGAK